MRGALLLLLGLAACGGPGGPPAADAGPARPAGTPIPPPAGTAVLPNEARTPTVPTLTLESPGALPHQPLRYQARPGASVARLDLEYQGEAIRFRLERATTVAGREVVHELRAIPEEGGARELAGRVSVDERGWAREIHLPFARGSAVRPDEPTETVHRVLALPAIPLPVEPVGRGARWRYRDRHLRAGVIVDRRLDVELLSLSGSRARLRVVLEEQAPRQRLVATPDLPLGARVTLTSLGTRAEGEVQLDLEEGGPPRLRLRVVPVLGYEVSADRQSESITFTDQPLEARVRPAGS